MFGVQRATMEGANKSFFNELMMRDIQSDMYDDEMIRLMIV